MRHWPNWKLDMELAFAEAFDFPDFAGRRWLARLRAEAKARGWV